MRLCLAIEILEDVGLPRLRCEMKKLRESVQLFFRLFFQYRKNDFAEVSKKLDTDLKIILLAHQNNYVTISSMLNNGCVQQKKQLYNCKLL